jgi:hypothetical protein
MMIGYEGFYVLNFVTIQSEMTLITSGEIANISFVTISTYEI